MPVIADLCPAGSEYEGTGGHETAPANGILVNIRSGDHIMVDTTWPGLTKDEHDWAFNRLAHLELKRFEKGTHPFQKAWKKAKKLAKEIEEAAKSQETEGGTVELETDDTDTGQRNKSVVFVDGSPKGQVSDGEMQYIYHQAAHTAMDAVKKKLAPKFRKKRAILENPEITGDDETAALAKVDGARGLNICLAKVEEMMRTCDDPTCDTPDGCYRRYLKAQGCDAAGVSATKVREALKAHRNRGKVLYTCEYLDNKGWTRVILNSLPVGIGPFGFVQSGTDASGLAVGDAVEYPEFVKAHHKRELTRKIKLKIEKEAEKAALEAVGASTIEVDAEIATLTADIAAHAAAI